MSSEMPDELIAYLVKLGESGRYEECNDIGDRFPMARSGSFMRFAPQPWYDKAEALNASQLASLIKALTVLEQRITNWRAGSVSPVIWLFKKLSERSHEESLELADWILSHTDNPYLPFGSVNHGARSLSELRDLSKVAQERSNARRSAEEQRQFDAKKHKASDATHKLFSALRRRDEKAIAALLRRGADMHAINEDGQTAVEIASALGLSRMLEGRGGVAESSE